MFKAMFLVCLLAIHASAASVANLVGDGKTDNSVELTELLQAGGIVELPPGRFLANVEINNVSGLVLRGSGKIATSIISAKPNTPALKINGCWFTKVQDCGFTTLSGLDCGVVEIEGGTLHGVQGNTFQDVLFHGLGGHDGKLSRFCLTIAKSVPNSQGSEHLFLNCHFFGASQACYYQAGFNALNNTFVGGNFQKYSKNAIELICGSINVFSTGFQSTYGYEQITNDGWDIVSTAGGAYESIIIAGCRTESLRFAKFAWPQFPQIMSCQQMLSIRPWLPSSVNKKGDVVILSDSHRTGKLYLCLEDNQSEVFDKDQWQWVDFNVVDIQGGVVANCSWLAGRAKHDRIFGQQSPTVTSDYVMLPVDTGVLVQVTDKPVTIWIWPATDAVEGQEIVIVRTGNTKHQVKVIGADQPYLLKTKKSVRLKALGYWPRKWYVID